MEYKLLEPGLANSVGATKPSYTTGNSPSLFASTSFLYVLFFVVIVIAAASRYTIAGIWRMEASDRGIQKSNEIFKRVTFGLLGVFSLWLILSTVNKDLLTGDVRLSELRTDVGSSNGSGVNNNRTNNTTNTGGSGTSRACDDEASVKASISSSAGICGNTSCTILSGCNYQQYLSTIQSESSRLGVDYKMIVVTMCKESSANPNAQHLNENGTYDCGLMQINQTTPCDANILNTQTNITRGIEMMKSKMNSSSASRVYSNIPAQAGVFASYNCCANGTAPNDESVSCKTSDGWPSIPKWACPIDPGTGTYNMCGVKAYACELVACLQNVP